MALPVFAKTITLKRDCFTRSITDINKVSTTIKLGKTTAKFNKKVESPYKDGGYMKFKAPKAGKYKIIIDNFDSGENTNFNVGHAKIYQCKKGWSYISDIKVKTEGGKSTTMDLCPPGSNLNDPDNELIRRYLYKRTTTLKLKKNQVIYVYLFGNTFGKSMDVTIKKVK